MATQGKLVGLPLATLTTLQTQAVAALTGILLTGQSYAIGGRSFNKKSDVEDLIQEINYAIQIANGTKIDRTVGRYRKPSY